jgi:hypothetical protein
MSLSKLSEPVFSAAWAVLEDRFNRKFNQATARVYYNILTTEMDDAQFKAACSAAFRFETFFPSPQQLIEYGMGGKDAGSRAMRRWGEMVERMRQGLSATDDPDERRLLMRATNGQPLGEVRQDQLPWVEKAWIRWYSDGARPRHHPRTGARAGHPAGPAP